MAEQLPSPRIVGPVARENIHEQAARVQGARLQSVYEHHEFIVLSTIVAPTSIKTIVNHVTNCSCGRAAGPFDIIERAQKMMFRNVGADYIEVRLNSATNDLFTLLGGEYLTWDMTEVDDIFIESAGAVDVPVKVVLA